MGLGISVLGRIVLILQDSELLDIVNNTTTNIVTVPVDAVARAAFDKRDIYAKRILIYAIKDRMIPHI